MAAGASVARSGVVVAAAAALATAATSAVCFTDRLHPLVPTILFHAANPSLLSSAASSSAGALNFSSSFHSSSVPRGSISYAAVDMRPSAPLPSGESTRIGSVQSFLHGVAHCSPSIRLCSTSTTGAITPLLNSSPLRPSYLYSTRLFPRDEIHSQFKAYATTTRAVPQYSFVGFSTSPRAIASSWSLNSLSFDTFDLSSHLASFFSSSLPSAPQAHLSGSVISSKNFHRWHEPTVCEPQNPEDDQEQTPGTKPVLTVVLLGWLGSQQKHLKKYADWYNARGINAVTFTVPMADILSLSVVGKAEEHVENLTNQLSAWLAEETTEGQKGMERQLIFHTFSNTGWLIYGVVLEKLSSRGNWVERIKGCVVDSAPAADLDPQVWASGFSAALLKKRSTASNGGGMRDSGIADSRHTVFVEKSKPHVAESAFLKLLEKFFVVFLQIPSINNRLSQVVTVLSKEQPPCPQLYIYSTADKVIPAKMVESFIEKQRQQGRIVRSCNFQSSPHVDHFRSFPEIYSNQVSNFLQECLPKSFTKRT
ncbi:unnamed protein product [Calypogeia fissa]